MKTFKLETAKTTYFESKEQYLEFVKFWSENHKGTSAAVQFLYLALRGKDIGKAFSPITNTSKMPSKGEHPYYGLHSTYDRLEWNFRSSNTEWDKKRQQTYVDALGGFVSAEQLAELIKSIPHPRNWKEI